MRIATPVDRLIRTAGIGLILAAGLVLVGCGDSGQQPGVAGGGRKATASATATGSGGTGDPMKWAKCLRDNGVDAKDPDPATGVVALPGDPNSPTLKAAMDKCKQYEAATRGKTGADPDDPKQQQYRLAFAKCMRDKGIDWPDPIPGKPMQVPQLTPQLRDAMNTCSEEVPGGPMAPGGTR